MALAFTLIVVAAAMLAPGLAVGPSLDAAVFDHVGGRLLQGVAPYVGAWDQKTPGIYLVAAAAQAILGWLGSWNAEWVLSVAVSAGIGLTVAATLARLGVTGWPRSAAAIGTTVFATHYLLALGGGLSEPPAALLAGSALVLAVRPAGTGRLVVIGALLGLATLISLQLLLGALVVLALAFVHLRREARALGAALLGIGFGAPVAAVLVWLLSIGALPAALDAILTYSAAYRSSGIAYGAELAAPVVAWTLLSSIYLITPALLGAVTVRSRLAERRITVIAMLFWAGATLILVIAEGRFYGHYAIALAVPLGILAGCGLSRVADSLRRAPRPRARAAIALPFIATLTVSFVAGVFAAELQVALVANGNAPVPAVSERVRLLPAGTMLVWGNEPYLYSLAERSPATRYSYLYPLTTPEYSTQYQVDGVLRALEANPPAVVVDAGSSAPGEPGFLPLLIDRPIAREGRELDLLDPLRAFVAARYRLDEIVSGWPIYVLRNPEP